MWISLLTAGKNGDECSMEGEGLRAEGETRSTIGGWRGCNKFVSVLGGDGTKIAPTGDIFDQPPGGMS